jgi:predicted Fe-S protein YdhL (DUF1289 family)
MRKTERIEWSKMTDSQKRAANAASHAAAARRKAKLREEKQKKSRCPKRI